MWISFWSITLKAVTTLSGNAENNLSFSPERLTQKVLRCLPFLWDIILCWGGDSSILLPGSMEASDESSGGGQNSELGPWKLGQESAVRFYLSQDKKGMLSDLCA